MIGYGPRAISSHRDPRVFPTRAARWLSLLLENVCFGPSFLATLELEILPLEHNGC